MVWFTTSWPGQKKTNFSTVGIKELSVLSQPPRQIHTSFFGNPWWGACVLVDQLYLTILFDPTDQGPTRLLHPWDSPGKNTGVGHHSLLQGIFPTQGSNPGLLHCRQTLLPSETRGKTLLPGWGSRASDSSAYLGESQGGGKKKSIPRVFQNSVLTTNVSKNEALLSCKRKPRCCRRQPP